MQVLAGGGFDTNKKKPVILKETAKIESVKVLNTG